MIAKFEEDVRKRSRLMRFLLVLDQMFNVLIWDGSQDETISSHIYRRIEAGKATRAEKMLCEALRKITRSSHCRESEGE